MKLHNTLQNEPIMSNVGEIGEFRIRNSSKAFHILSSSLYANKIRAVIRELSCNAYDSHVAAGKADVPFDVTLPTTFNAFFAVRDYGVGLDHDQVTNIYTTYFESTKSDSNDFIGALGLGSKSPFSYTENFTVTAIKNGIKGIYTAFLNEQGVPSIALMHSEETTEPNGVEVKFAVSDRGDFHAFEHEARMVYRFFKTVPNVVASEDFEIPALTYKERDIIPGVHLYEGRSAMTAVMGNIAYPVDLPSNSIPEDLYYMFQYAFELHFDIGELDFQASREGLSYIPETVTAIVEKMKLVKDKMKERFEENLTKIPTVWQKVAYVSKHRSYHYSGSSAFYSIAEAHAKENPIPKQPPKGLNKNHHSYGLRIIGVGELANRFNIKLYGAISSGNNKANRIHTYSYWDYNGHTAEYWRFNMGADQQWIVQNTTRGAYERMKYHVRVNNIVDGAYLLTPFDTTKPMKTDRFFKWLGSPTNIIKATDMAEKPVRARVNTSEIPVLTLCYNSRGRRDNEYTWSDAGPMSKFDDSEQRVYVHLKGFTPQFTERNQYTNVKDLHNDINSVTIGKFGRVRVFGVRTACLEAAEQASHWVTVEDFISEQAEALTDLDLRRIAAGLASVDLEKRLFNEAVLRRVKNADSDYKTVFDTFQELSEAGRVGYMDASRFQNMIEIFSPKTLKRLEAQVDFLRKMSDTVKTTYPLFQFIYYATAEEISKYINLVDNAKEQ